LPKGNIMRTVKYATNKLTETFYRRKVLNMGTIKTVLGTGSKMTVLRKLKVLGYYASYSHAGRYYTLDEIACFNRYGLWSFEDIYFSSQGSLVNTLEHLISSSEEGCFAAELQELCMFGFTMPWQGFMPATVCSGHRLGRSTCI
jgi:hypothetical protein